MLYYSDGEGNPSKAGFMILDYKTNTSLCNDNNRKLGKKLLHPFSNLIEEYLSLYAIQLSLYSLMLEYIGISIIDRKIV